MRIAVELAVATVLLAGCRDVVRTDDINGEWRVDDVFCSTCTSVDRSDVGRVLRIAATGIQDPFAGGRCPGNVGQREMQVSMTLANEVRRKLNPEWFVPTAPSSELRMIAVTCENMDFVTLVILSGGHLGYVAEGDIAYRLNRERH